MKKIILSFILVPLYVVAGTSMQVKTTVRHTNRPGTIAKAVIGAVGTAASAALAVYFVDAAYLRYRIMVFRENKDFEIGFLLGGTIVSGFAVYRGLKFTIQNAKLALSSDEKNNKSGN